MLWGLARAGSRIRGHVDRALGVAVRKGLIEGGPFYVWPSTPLVLRDSSVVTSPTLRKPEMLPTAEIRQAVLELITANYGAGRHALVLRTAQRRVGEESVITCRSRSSPLPSQTTYLSRTL